MSFVVWLAYEVYTTVFQHLFQQLLVTAVGMKIMRLTT